MKNYKLKKKKEWMYSAADAVVTAKFSYQLPK